MKTENNPAKWFDPPARVWSRAQILQPPSCCPVPKEKGIYAWFFRSVPKEIPLRGCVCFKDLTLLYVGVAPKAPAVGSPVSKRTLFDRLRGDHLRGNASGSTLRLSLGCLLANDLKFQLRRVGKGERLTFAAGEEMLNRWIGENAYVCWHVHPKPWLIEVELLKEISLPLNLKGNENHPFYETLSAIRRNAKEQARSLPVIIDSCINNVLCEAQKKGTVFEKRT